MKNLNRPQLRELEQCYLKVQANCFAQLEAIKQRIKELEKYEAKAKITAAIAAADAAAFGRPLAEQDAELSGRARLQPHAAAFASHSTEP